MRLVGVVETPRRARRTVVGLADGRDVGHRRVQGEQVFDLLRGDVLAAADDHVLLAVGDRQVAVGVEPPDVAGAEPTAGEERVGIERRIAVTDEQFGAEADDLAVLAEADLAIVVVEQPDLVARGGQPSVRARRSSGSPGVPVVITGCSLDP